MYDQFGVPRRDFSKLPCKKCRLRTEHVRLSLPDGEVRFLCLRCSAQRTESEVAHDYTVEELLDVPPDESIPVGVA